MNLKGTQTEQNLLKAFAGESQARNRYTYFASVAKKEGYEQIASIFLETSENEKEHAKIFFKHLETSGGEPVEITASYPAGREGTTEENLLAAAEGENIEWGILYPAFAETARQEVFPEIEDSFREIRKVEAEHEKRYRKLLENVRSNQVFKKSGAVRWKCRNCGYIHDGESAPKECPACRHPQGYYELLAENY